jgi:hypothetical protein
LRLGQQELIYGTGRLVDNNEGVNVKSRFYGARVIAKTEKLRLEIFGVKPTELNTGTFDDHPAPQQTFWGAYGTVPLPLVDQHGQADLYYLGIDTTRATYQQGSGCEIRHSIGTRLFNHQPGAPFEPGFDYNWELVYQLGTFGKNYINAWTVATETGYTFPVRLTPRLALRADVASGGQHPNGGTLNTFNPLFPRGAYFGPKLTMFGPYNLLDSRYFQAGVMAMDLAEAREADGRRAARAARDQRRARARCHALGVSRPFHSTRIRRPCLRRRAVADRIVANDLTAINGRADERSRGAQGGGERVLEVGTGSSYQAAVLTRLAKEVYSIECIEGLQDRARVILIAMGVTGAIESEVR